MDFGGFIGRFHPLFVHLPIGLLLLAGIFEYFARKPKHQKLHTAVAWTLLLGAIFAIFSSVSGWLLANRGAYIERSLFLHRWLGIAVAVFATLCWLIKTNRIKLGASTFRSLLAIMIIGVFATGHYGGNMTHGEDYLFEYAPAAVRNMFGHGEKEAMVYNFKAPTTVKVYGDLLQPVFEESCWKCHNPDNPLGGLDLTTKATFLKGGDRDQILESGDARQSELFKRMILPAADRKSMPPFGGALPYHQIRLIEWWINEGASFEKTLGDFELPRDIKKLLEEEYGISFLQKSALESIVVVEAPKEAIDLVVSKGFLVSGIAKNNNLLDVAIKPINRDIPKDKFASLSKIKDQITWLSLPDSKITEAQLAFIGELRNLTRLRLQDNALTDAGVQKLENLPILESLNLVGTSITDKALESIKKMSSLKLVYVFRTEVSKEAIEELRNARPDLEVVNGFQFEEIQ